MNQGKRYIRNTALVLGVATALMAIATRVYSARVDDSTPQWLRNVMSFGLKVIVTEQTEDKPETMTAVGLADLGEFSRVEIGNVSTVEIVGAKQFKASMISPSGMPAIIAVERGDQGLVRFKGGADAIGAVLRIEAPTLTSIALEAVDEFTVRGLEASAVSLRMKDVKSARLLDGNVDSWSFDSTTPVRLRVGNSQDPNTTEIVTTGRMTLITRNKAKEEPQE